VGLGLVYYVDSFTVEGFLNGSGLTRPEPLKIPLGNFEAPWTGQSRVVQKPVEGPFSFPLQDIPEE